jgi:hypothetical protein
VDARGPETGAAALLNNLTNVMICITSLQMSVYRPPCRISEFRLLVPASYSGMSACLESTRGYRRAAKPNLEASSGLTVLSSSRGTLVVQAILGELNAIEGQLKSLWSSAHECAHVYSDEVFSKKRFWRLYEQIDNSTNLLTGSRSLDWDDPLFVGLDQIQLSSRQIELIFNRVFSSLRDTDLEGLTLVSHLRATLAHEIRALVRIVGSATSVCSEVTFETVRDRILSLVIHTGSSPPAKAIKGLAGSKAESEIPALQVKYAAIFRQENGSYLSYPIWQRRSAAHFGRSTRNHAPSCRFSKSSGRWGDRPHHSMAQSKRDIWARGRG